MKEQALEAKAKRIAQTRIEEAVKSFPSKQKFVELKVERAKHARKMIRKYFKRPALTPVELDEIRQTAQKDYPETLADKHAYIRRHAHDYNADVDNIMKELKSP